MRLEFLFMPTRDLDASLALWVDGLGLTEAWREGDSTTALALPGTDVQLMLDSHDPTAPVGPVFVVEDVASFHSARPAALEVVEEPSPIPGGTQVVYREPGGGVLYVVDQAETAPSWRSVAAPSRVHRVTTDADAAASCAAGTTTTRRGRGRCDGGRSGWSAVHPASTPTGTATTAGGQARRRRLPTTSGRRRGTTGSAAGRTPTRLTPRRPRSRLGRRADGTARCCRRGR